MAPAGTAFVPSAPAAKPMAGQAQQEFSQLKHSLSDIASWEIVPNGWGNIQIIYTLTGSEKQSRAFLSAISLPTPEM